MKVHRFARRRVAVVAALLTALVAAAVVAMRVGRSSSSATAPSVSSAATETTAARTGVESLQPGRSPATSAPPSGTSTTTVRPPPADAGPTRAVPAAAAPEPAPVAPPPPWAALVTLAPDGTVRTPIGCAAGPSAAELDRFFTARLGPMMGADYQHVVSLGGGRAAWFFQDMFIDPGGTAKTLTQSRFVHNAALLQQGNCFTLVHRGTAAEPTPFEAGIGVRSPSTWLWPMGGERVGGTLKMFWVEMLKDAVAPGPIDGLGWHPVATYLATYDARTLARRTFALAPDAGVTPIYGYAVASDTSHTYLFGNTFEQNLTREGGFYAQRHSATAMYLARVPLGQLDQVPEYWNGNGWTANTLERRPFTQDYWVENPMQPRFLGGQWIAVAKVDGYWGEALDIRVAQHPWGPWTTAEHRTLPPRGGDALMNTYHAHLLPWLVGGKLVVTVSQNARDMTRDAFPRPSRYRIQVVAARLVPAPPDPPPTTTSTTSTTTSTTSTSTTTSTTVDTTTSTTVDTTTTTTTSTTTSTTTTSTTTTSTTSPG